MDEVILGHFRNEELQRILDHAGSWKRFREMLGLNGKQYLTLTKQRQLSLRKLGCIPPEQIVSELKRIGSTALFCIIYECKESELRSVALNYRIDLRTVCAPIGHNSGIGRLGENYFKQIRGQMVATDALAEYGHTHAWDFRDLIYGLVNVKTATRSRYTAKTRAKDANFWHFSIKGWKDCDHLALVPLTAQGEPWRILMVRCMDFAYWFDGIGHFTLTEREITRFSSPMQNDLGRPEWEREYLLLPAVMTGGRSLEQPAEV
jgi:hypothetical protein